MPTAENEVTDAEISLTGGAWYEDGFNYYAQNKNDTYALTVPNDAGGVTAFVTAYAAVNPNTKCAEEVFKYLELFYSDAVQSDNGLRDKETKITYGALARSNMFALLSADVSTVTANTPTKTQSCAMRLTAVSTRCAFTAKRTANCSNTRLWVDFPENFRKIEFSSCKTERTVVG